LKKDIFKGKIKKEYFSYILGCMIFFILLFAVGGALCIYAFVLEGSFNVSGERLLLAIFGVVAFVLGGGYVFPQLFLIRNFPKYPKLRRIFFNSDIYFTDSTSDEYFGGSRTRRGRRAKAAFELVTIFAQAEKSMGDNKPRKYKIYLAFASVLSVFGLVDLIAMPLLFEKGAIFPFVTDELFWFCCLSFSIICVGTAVFLLVQALKVAMMASLENHKWAYELYNELVDMAVRKNNKKLKFWFKRDQIEEIENIVKSASENAELMLKTNGNKIVSFSVIDTLNNRKHFTGYFL